MPYWWPEGPLVGPVRAKRAWEVAAVLLFFVLIGVIVFIATKSWSGGAP